MAFSISRKKLKDKDLAYIYKKCNIKPEISDYDQEPDEIKVFLNLEKRVVLPLDLWPRFYDKFPNKDHTVTYYNPLEYTGLELMEKEDRDQKTVLNEALLLLDKYHSCVLNLRTGFGKTRLGIVLMTQLEYMEKEDKFGKILIVCYVKKLLEQWKEELEKNVKKKNGEPVKVQIVSGKTLKDDYDIYVMGTLKCKNFDEDQLRCINLVVVDEAHIACDALSKTLLRLRPIYLIGLSATMDRPADRLDRLLHPFMGEESRFIKREETKPFTVIKYETDFKPKIVKRSVYLDGRRVEKPDWTIVQNSIAHNQIRQNMIADMIKYCYDNLKDKNEKIMVLSKRVCECVGCDNNKKCKYSERVTGILKLVKDMGIKADYMVGTKSEWNKNVNVLIGGVKKIGVGFDNSDMRYLFMISDVVDVRQNEGRLRDWNVTIYDFVDCYSTLERHWTTRKKWYKKRGASFEVVRREEKLHKSKKKEGKKEIKNDKKLIKPRKKET
jgi:hypothetical protein